MEQRLIVSMLCNAHSMITELSLKSNCFMLFFFFPGRQMCYKCGYLIFQME